MVGKVLHDHPVLAEPRIEPTRIRGNRGGRADAERQREDGPGGEADEESATRTRSRAWRDGHRHPLPGR
jgi:hypothetical protein